MWLSKIVLAYQNTSIAWKAANKNKDIQKHNISEYVSPELCKENRL
jgi:hypothetical protein